MHARHRLLPESGRVVPLHTRLHARPGQVRFPARTALLRLRHCIGRPDGEGSLRLGPDA